MNAGAGAMEGFDGADRRAVGPPSSSGPVARSACWFEDRKMEHPANQTVAYQGLELGDADKTQPVTAAPKTPSRTISLQKLKNYKPKAVDADAPAADADDDLLQEIKNLKNKDDAIKRLHELEERHEKTFFEIGGVLSAIHKNKWFDPYASLDEWVENNTAMKRSMARGLIQVYDAIVNSGVKWAKVKHLGWTKLRVIAGVLDEANADHWIEKASNCSRAEIKKLVQAHLAELAGQKPSPSTTTQVKTFTCRGGQIEKIEAAIDKVKRLTGETDESTALEFICRDFVDRDTPMTPDALAVTVADHINSLDEDAAEAFRELVGKYRVERATSKLESPAG